jgi:hypothetical protein
MPASSPFGVAGPAPATQPFGGFSTPTAQVSPPPGHVQEHQQGSGSAVPQQRQQGTVYGASGFDAIDMTMPVSTNPVDNSGSLTGHILAQGWHDEIVDRRRSNLKVVIAMLVVLGLMVTASLVFLLTAGDAFGNMVKGLFG